jgi:hypothetical protein
MEYMSRLEKLKWTTNKLIAASTSYVGFNVFCFLAEDELRRYHSTKEFSTFCFLTNLNVNS